MIAIAKSNAKNRGLERDIHFEVKKFEKSDASLSLTSPSRILTNPPYGKRIQSSELDSLYQNLYASYGDATFGGVITSFEQVKPDSRIRNAKPLFNGDDKCIFWHRRLP